MRASLVALVVAGTVGCGSTVVIGRLDEDVEEEILPEVPETPLPEPTPTPEPPPDESLALSLTNTRITCDCSQTPSVFVGIETTVVADLDASVAVPITFDVLSVWNHDGERVGRFTVSPAEGMALPGVTAFDLVDEEILEAGELCTVLQVRLVDLIGTADGTDYQLHGVNPQLGCL